MRIRTILAAAATPAALAAALLGTTGTAHAAVLPNPKTIVTINSQEQANTLMASGVIGKNVDVPQGVSIKFDGGSINGNVTVEGQLAINGVTVNGNVTVSGGGPAGSASELSLYNNPSHITGNLWVHDSAGGPNGNGSNNGTSFFTNADESWGPTPVTQVDGNFTFQNNSGWLQVLAAVHVGGNFTATGNGPYTWDGAFNASGVTAHSPLS